MRPVWDLMVSVMSEITDNQNNLLKAINEVEEKLANQSFLQRALQLKNNSTK
jgi:MarR family transcriptional repressor of mepA